MNLNEKRERSKSLLTSTPKQRAEWLLMRFTTKEDANEHIDQVIEIFVGYHPPLVSEYWKKVKYELSKLQ